MKKIIFILLTFYITSFANADIVVGGKNFTEQQLLAEITTRFLNEKGFPATKKAGMGTTVLRTAQENGQIDLYWEYTGTSLITFNKVEDKLSADEVYNKVKELDAEKDLVWLQPSNANNTYALAMKKEDANDKNIKTISDLAKKINEGEEFILGSNAEFYARPDGFKPLQDVYGFELERKLIKRMDTGLVYQALKDGDVDFGVVFATDGRIPAFNFYVLEDDLDYFTAYYVAPVIRKEILEANPMLEELLNNISAKLNDNSLAALNASVDVDKVSIETAAENFLKENGLL